MKIHIAFCTLLMITVNSAYAQHNTRDTAYLQNVVCSLASDSLYGRLAGTEYERKAAEWIATQFKENRIKPLFRKNYYQSFTWTADSVIHNSTNVIGQINNKADKTIIIGAHYDHIGMGGKRSRSYGKHEIHNGADDNASGVAVMLFLAKELKNNGNEKFNYIFIALSAHEPGLFGSHFFVDNNIIDSGSIELFINIDMVGRLNKENPILFFSMNEQFTDSLFGNECLSKYGIKLMKKEMSAGDHTAFAKQNINVLFLTTGIHDDYHRISDDVEKINFSGMMMIENFIFDFIKKL